MNNQMRYLSNEDLQRVCPNGKWADDIVVIDIREPDEYRREHIPGSKNIPIGKLADADLTQDKHKTAIFHCRSGQRTKNAKDAILSCGFKESYCMTAGIEQWKACRLPTVSDKSAPIEMMRQVQMIAGSLIVLGILLSYVISPTFIALSAFVGAGLMYAGISGTCYLAKVLAYMPWNRN